MAWTTVNPVTIGNATKKADYDKLWDNCDFFKIEHNTDGMHKFFETSKLYNIGIAATVAAKALTVALKGADGNNPSATNPVVIGFRNATLTTGTPSVRTITGALSVVLSSGSTLGFTAAAAGRIYVWAIDNAGTVELALSRTADIFPESNLVSTTAEGGAGGADSASVIYSTTARSNVACRCIGYIEITTGAVAGEWDNAPSKIQVMGPGVKRTGDVVQIATPTVKTDTFTTTSTSFTDITGLAVSLTPQSAINRVLVLSVGYYSATASYPLLLRLMRDATVLHQGDAAGSRVRTLLELIGNTYGRGEGGALLGSDIPGGTSSVSYHVEVSMLPGVGGTFYCNYIATDADSNSYSRGASIIIAIEVMT